MLKNKRIVVGVTGGIAAYKAVDLVSMLIKEGAQVKVIMSPNSLNFVQPLTFQTISGNQVYHDTFARVEKVELDHISLAKWGDLMVIAPATANVLGKVCHGVADDLLTTTIMATSAKVLFAPAMNTGMYTNPIVQNNLKLLKSYGYGIIPPASGRLACGDVGEGKLASVEDILSAIRTSISTSQDLKGIRVLVTAGPTREYIDPVRFISNPSSGKMGVSLAKACLERGAEVDLVLGPVFIDPPAGANIFPIKTAQEMYDQVMRLYPKAHVVFKSAAVGDYRPEVIHAEKIKKGQEPLVLELVRNPDILEELGKRKSHQVLVGFAAETQNLEGYAREKMAKKNLDFIFANQVTKAGSGFEVDTNQGILLTQKGEVIELPLLSKEGMSHEIINQIAARISLDNLRNP